MQYVSIISMQCYDKKTNFNFAQIIYQKHAHLDNRYASGATLLWIK